MGGGWIEQDARHGAKNVLSPRGKSEARPFALCARDVYPDQTGRDRAGIALKYNWIEILETNKDRALGVSLAPLRTMLGRAFGFNAALYRLPDSAATPWALAYEGSATLAVKSPRDVARAVQDWVLTNAATTFDFVNYLEPLVTGSVFTKFLNPRQAPSTQYDLAQLVAEAARQIVGDDMVLTGHSLGGGLASYAAALTGLRAVVFNSAGVGVRCVMKMDLEALERTICHLATTTDPAMGQVLKGYAMQAGGAAQASWGLSSANTAAMLNGFQAIGVGRALSQSAASGVGSLADQVVNKFVTSYTDPLSRHLGSLYVIGVGGHGMDEILKHLN